jgi:hypothetical protein
LQNGVLFNSTWAPDSGVDKRILPNSGSSTRYVRRDDTGRFVEKGPGKERSKAKPNPTGNVTTVLYGPPDEEKYIVIKGSTSFAKWGTLVVEGHVFSRSEIDRPGIDLDYLLKQGVIRPATKEEVEDFDKKFPKEDNSAALAGFTAQLELRYSKAKTLPEKAALCLEFVKELGSLEAQVKAVFNRTGELIGYREEDILRYHVLKGREISRLVAPCEKIREYIKRLAEPLMIAAEGLNDPSFASTPLQNMLDHWDQQYHNQPNPTFYPAEEYLKRLRLKLLSRGNPPEGAGKLSTIKTQEGLGKPDIWKTGGTIRETNGALEAEIPISRKEFEESGQAPVRLLPQDYLDRNVIGRSPFAKALYERYGDRFICWAVAEFDRCYEGWREHGGLGNKEEYANTIIANKKLLNANSFLESFHFWQRKPSTGELHSLICAAEAYGFIRHYPSDNIPKPPLLFIINDRGEEEARRAEERRGNWTLGSKIAKKWNDIAPIIKGITAAIGLIGAFIIAAVTNWEKVKAVFHDTPSTTQPVNQPTTKKG